MLQIQHQPQQQSALFLTQSHQLPASSSSSSPPSTSLFAPAALFSSPPPKISTQMIPARHQSSVPLQHSLWQQNDSSSSSSSYSSLSPVASAAHLLEARLHISQQPHLHVHPSSQLQLQSYTQGQLSLLPPQVSWSLGHSRGPDTPELQEQQLSSCVMVK